MLKSSARSAGKRLTPIALAVAILGAAPAANANPPVPPVHYDCPADAYGCFYDGKYGAGDRYVVRDCGIPVRLPSYWWDRIESGRAVQASELKLRSYRNDGNPASQYEVFRAPKGHSGNAHEPNTADIIDCRL